MKTTNVLIVDDSTLTVKLVVKLLLQNGIDGYHFDEDHIFTANDGLEAFETLSAFPEISLIISAVNTPTLSGDELLDILIDTGKISNIEVLFMTDKETQNQLSSISLKNILGVIEKPFNKENFSQKFNDLLKHKQELLADLVVIQKENHTKQDLLIKVIRTYLKQHDIVPDVKFLIGLLQEQFDYDTRILDQELLSLLPMVIEEYFALNELEGTVDNHLLQAIFTKLNHPQEVFSIVDPFHLRSSFEANLKHVSSHMADLKKVEAQDVLNMIFQEIDTDMNMILSKVMMFPKLPFQLFQPNFELVIEKLSAYDGGFNDYTLQEKFAQYKELIEFHAWMKNFYQASEIYTLIPALKQSSQLVAEINKKLQIIFKYISASILHFTGAIEDLIWRRAKASASIMKFCREKMPGKIPNTKHLLMHFEKLSKAEIKEYEAFEHEKVIIISNFLATLQEVKSKQEEHFPLWHMYGFSKANMVESWLTSNNATKIILDYDFSTPVFTNGVQYLHYLVKQFPKIAPLLRGDKLFILSSGAKVDEISQHKDTMDFVLIPKPLKALEIQRLLMYS